MQGEELHQLQRQRRGLQQQTPTQVLLLLLHEVPQEQPQPPPPPHSPLHHPLHHPLRHLPRRPPRRRI